MRLQHLKQTASGLSADDAARVAAKAVIVEEAGAGCTGGCGMAARGRANQHRSHSCGDASFSGRARRARRSEGRSHPRESCGPPCTRWMAISPARATGWSNYAERHRAGLRVGTAITEGTANFLVNRRMNKSQQMRWSRQGANLPLQVRCAVLANGNAWFLAMDRVPTRPTIHVRIRIRKPIGTPPDPQTCGGSLTGIVTH